MTPDHERDKLHIKKEKMSDTEDEEEFSSLPIQWGVGLGQNEGKNIFYDCVVNVRQSYFISSFLHFSDLN